MNICDFSSAAVSSARVLLSYSGPRTSPEPFYAPNTNCPEYFYFTDLLNQLISKSFFVAFEIGANLCNCRQEGWVG